jgi:hypothetical protein
VFRHVPSRLQFGRTQRHRAPLVAEAVLASSSFLLVLAAGGVTQILADS